MKEFEKNIVIVNQDSGYLMIDIANAYQKKGYQVTLITGRLVERSTVLNVNINCERIIYYNKKTLFFRIFTWLMASVQICLLIKFKYSKSELLIVSNPPFAPLLTLFFKNNYSILIYDVFPNALVDAHVLSQKSYIVKIWKKINVKVFKKAKKVFTITNGMNEVLQEYVEETKIKVIPIWADNISLKPIDKNKNIFIETHKLFNKFIVMYSGNIAKTGDADIMVKLAELTTDQEVIYVIIGEGVNKNTLQKQIEIKRLGNCIMLPWQSTKLLAHSLSAASISIVSLGKDVTKVAMPSKIYSCMSVGSPVLSIASHDSDLAILVTKNKIGFNFEESKLNDIYSFIIALKSDSELQKFYSINSLLASKLFCNKNANEFIL